MGKTVKIAVSIPEDLLREAEKERRKDGESRSAFVQRAIQISLKQRKKDKAIKSYIQGYQHNPESKEEIEAARRVAEIVLVEEPWE